MSLDNNPCSHVGLTNSFDLLHVVSSGIVQPSNNVVLVLVDLGEIFARNRGIYFFFMVWRLFSVTALIYLPSRLG
jgi:hypothetical protein